MESGTANEILLLVKDAGFMDEDIPEGEAEILSLGKWWGEQAMKAKEGGNNDETVLAVVDLVLGETGGSDESGPPVEPNEEPSDNESPAQEEQAEHSDSNPDENHEPGEELAADSPLPDDQQAEAREREPLPIPPQVQGKVLELPRDLTSLTDRDVRRLMGEYNALFARVVWLASVEGSDLANAEHMVEHTLRVSRRKVDRYDEDGKRRNQEEINDEARADTDFLEWERRALEHDKQFREYRALREIYSGHLERLSREASIRDQEYQRGG